MTGPPPARPSVFLALVAAGRVQYVLHSALALAVGAATGPAAGVPLPVVDVVLLFASLLCHHLGMEYFDEVFDYLRFRRRQGRDGPATIFTGGAGVLVSGQLSAVTVFAVGLAFYVAAAVAGFWLVFGAGYLPLLAYGLFGAAWSIGYAAPGIKLSSRGLGELGILLNVGPVLGAVGATVAFGHDADAVVVGLRGVAVTLPLGLLSFAMLLVQNIADLDEDRTAGKRTLAVRLGPVRAARLVQIACGAAFAVTALLPLVGLMPPAGLALLVLAPWGLRQVGDLHRRAADAPRLQEWMARFPLYSVRVTLGYGLLGVLLVQAWREGQGTGAAWLAGIAAGMGGLCRAGRWLAERHRAASATGEPRLRAAPDGC